MDAWRLLIGMSHWIRSKNTRLSTSRSTTLTAACEGCEKGRKGGGGGGIELTYCEEGKKKKKKKKREKNHLASFH